MAVKPGTIIKSTAALNNTVFENVYIIITTHNIDGATAFVINKLFDKPLNALQEFNHIRHFNLYNGGPVDTEHLFFIHRRPDVIDGSNKICEGIFYGGNFAQAIHAINSNTITAADIKIFIGYCGWDTGELEAEVEEGSWEITSQNSNTVFNTYL
jgi:putative transcriptional regulator